MCHFVFRREKFSCHQRNRTVDNLRAIEFIGCKVIRNQDTCIHKPCGCYDASRRMHVQLPTVSLLILHLRRGSSCYNFFLAGFAGPGTVSAKPSSNGNFRYESRSRLSPIRPLLFIERGRAPLRAEMLMSKSSGRHDRMRAVRKAAACAVVMYLCALVSDTVVMRASGSTLLQGDN